MPLKIVRNDITKMPCDAIVNTASSIPAERFEEVGSGCDLAIHKAAGAEELIAARLAIGVLEEGEAAATPGFDLPARYIIHAVSPVYIDGASGEEERLRNCYRNSLRIAEELGISSIAFPLISTGSFGYPQEEGLRIAVDEINSYLLDHDLTVYLVVFGTRATELGRRIYPELEAYIDHHYVDEKREEEYGDAHFGSLHPGEAGYDAYRRAGEALDHELEKSRQPSGGLFRNFAGAMGMHAAQSSRVEAPAPSKAGRSATGGPFPGHGRKARKSEAVPMDNALPEAFDDEASGVGACEEISTIASAAFDETHESRLNERVRHLEDTFSEYLMYLIAQKGLNPVDVYKRAIVDKKVFSKIKNNPKAHPTKMTAMCLCVGAQLNPDETRDLLARAGYALSPSDMTDIIFSYFIENGIYDMIELDIQLEDHGLKCLIN